MKTVIFSLLVFTVDAQNAMKSSSIFSEKYFSDDCNLFEYMCGDKCTDVTQSCQCGAVTLRAPLEHFSDQFCCVKNGTMCTAQSSITDTICNSSNATVIRKSEPCQGLCYNDYHSSEKLGEDAHLACDSGQCMPVKNMCQGVHCTDTVEECNGKIRCGLYGLNKNNTDFKIGKVRNLTIAPDHFYCQYNSSLDTRTYEHLDRSDEENVTNILLEQGLRDISLQTCSDKNIIGSDRHSGLLCKNHCKLSYEWCRGDSIWPETCLLMDNLTTLQSTDPRLCGDHQLWRDVECNGYGVYEYSVHCWGTSQHCILPWYYTLIASQGFALLQKLRNCEDKSDRIHPVDTNCDVEVYLQIYKTYYPYYPVSIIKDWLDHTNTNQDPHGCRQSCSERGPGCAACTNPENFLCAKSGVCVHPELRCDGHPQCQHGEDEDAASCLDIWVRSGVVSPAASMPCSSRQYPGMPILATACDGIIECFESVDEVNCKNESWPHYLLAATIAIMLTIYLALKYNGNKNKETLPLPLVPGQDKTVKRVLADYLNHRDNPDIVAEVNMYLLFWIQTLPTDESNVVCKRFFALEANIHKNNESEIFHSLHKHFHPLLVERIYNAQFPGLECLESYSNYRVFI